MGVFEEETPMEERVLDVIESNPEYEQLLKEIVGWEEDHQGEYNDYDYSQNYTDTAWDMADLPSKTNPGKIGYLKREGIVGKVRDSNSNTITSLWALKDREAVKEALTISRDGEVATVDKEVDDDKIPDDLFEPIVGHEDVKELFNASIETEEPVHIILVGPPACGKTVFLEEISRLPETEFLIGSSTTGVGLIDQLFDKRPKNILIDEFDKMDKEDYGNLLSLQEDGIVKETKGNNKRREMKLDGATVYATANRVENVPSENLSRFMGDPVIQLPEYDDDEFLEVTENVLTMREGVSEEMAKVIGDVIVNETDIRDFRECRRIARLAKTEGDEKNVEESVRKYTSIIKKFGPDAL